MVNGQIVHKKLQNCTKWNILMHSGGYSPKIRGCPAKFILATSVAKEKLAVAKIIKT